MTIENDPHLTGRRQFTGAQHETYLRICAAFDPRGGRLARETTLDGMAVVYFNLRGRRRAAYIDAEGWAVRHDGDRWVRFDAPYNPPQLTLGV